MNTQMVAPNHALLSEFSLPNGQANQSLVFDRYLEIWEISNRFSIKRTNDLYPQLEKFASKFVSTDPKLLEVIHARQEWLLKSTNPTNSKAGDTFFYEVAWRMTSGLGNDHPIENGFAMDSIYGIPYISASAVKGLCRHVARFFADQVEETDHYGWDDETIEHLFGSENTDLKEEKTSRQGDIVFLDAYPLSLKESGKDQSKVEVEIINCHHQTYYGALEKMPSVSEQDREKRTCTQPSTPPLETDSPVPVFFLTLGAGTQFAFRLFSRSGSNDNLNTVAEVLHTGLRIFGIGAKTAVGYGRFLPADSKPEQSSEASRWLNKTIEAIQEQHHISKRNEVLRGKLLAKAWQGISDPDLKAAVKKEIQKLWQTADLNIKPKVQQLYEE